MNIQATFTQCKQITDNGLDLRETIELINDQPIWIVEQHCLDIADIQAIQQGGCASGAYMPTVTYYTANKVMAEHGDDIFDYIEGQYGEVPQSNETSWSHMAVFYYSLAVELWAGQFNLDGVNWD